MSCPDWRHLDPAVREAPNASAAGAASRAGAASWEEALRHFDGGCRLCRHDALAADPTLLFRRLAPMEMTAAAEAQEIERARLAVTAMRAASRLDGHDSAPPRAAANRPRPARGLHHRAGLRWAMAAGLTAMALLSGAGRAGSSWQATSGPALDRSGTADAPAAAGRAAATGSSMADLPADLGAMPAANRSSIEGFSRPEARVYQIDGPHMSVVMIVDDKLDV
jgi:hypothetical protein